MTEGRTTAVFCGVAILALAVTWVAEPRSTPSSTFAERGEAMFPALHDPNAVASLEIAQFDPRAGVVRPFKIQNRDGRWTIPSEHDYPADAKDRLSQIAAALVVLKKDDVASENAADYERYGVLDPLDTTLPGIGGRGDRVVVRGARDEVLADVIFGKPVEGHAGFRYLRDPRQKRVYVSRVGDLQLSTAFSDWIERDVLEVDPIDIDAVNLRNYALNRSTRGLDPGETLLLEKKPDDSWTMNGVGGDERLDLNAIDGLLRSLAALTIIDVLPKPPGITAMLTHAEGRASVSQAEMGDLARKGFYLTPEGQLVSNRGEAVVRTKQGLYYTLRFGDIAAEVNAPDANASAPDRSSGPATPIAAASESRYLFVMVDFDPRAARTPGMASDGAQRLPLLRARFAPWYYVIAAESFQKIRLRRQDLVKPRDENTR